MAFKVSFRKAKSSYCPTPTGGGEAFGHHLAAGPGWVSHFARACLLPHQRFLGAHLTWASKAQMRKLPFRGSGGDLASRIRAHGSTFVARLFPLPLCCSLCSYFCLLFPVPLVFTFPQLLTRSACLPSAFPSGTVPEGSPTQRARS